MDEQSIWTNIRLLQEWGPAVTFIQAFLMARDVQHKALAVADAAEWLAAKTNTKVDDELVVLLTDVLKSAEGEALLKWILEKAGGPKA